LSALEALLFAFDAAVPGAAAVAVAFQRFSIPCASQGSLCFIISSSSSMIRFLLGLFASMRYERGVWLAGWREAT
jgi:hypothetical protein